MLEFDNCRFDPASPGANRPGHPVESSQLVENRSLDAVDRIGLEFEATFRFEFVDRIDEAEESITGQVILIDRTRKTRTNSSGHIFHQRRVMENQSFTGISTTGSLEDFPQTFDLSLLIRLSGGFGHRYLANADG